MNFDFPTLLVTATLLTGLAWGVDALVWAPRRNRNARQLEQQGMSPDSLEVAAALKEPTWVEYCKSFFPVILAVLLLRSFVVEPFRIPSGSMMPTLLVGDFILVNKYAYGIRLPVLNTKIIDIGEPQRGDVVVFRYPRDPSVDYIKRVVGVPGDHIGYYNKVLHINGKPVKETPEGVYVGKGSGVSMSGAEELVEQLGDVRHEILEMPHTPSMEGEYVVKANEYFVMGDNRDNSNDSRYWGPVPEKNLVGKAFRIWMNWDAANGGIAWDRIGMKIQ
jgi:signal peptidase I